VHGAPLVLASVLLLAADLGRDPAPVGGSAPPASPATPVGRAAPAPAGWSVPPAPAGRSVPPAPAGRSAAAAKSAEPAAAAAAAEPTYFESVDVDVVNVEVFVADRHGDPAVGLQREDFAVLEDGRPVPITHFFSAGAAADDRLPQPAPEPAAGKGRAPVPAAAGGATGGAGALAEQRLDLAVLVDNSTLTPPARNRALSSLRDFLASRLRPRDRVLVASYARELTVVQEPTSDRAAVAAALESISGESGAGVRRAAEMRQLLEEMARAKPPSSRGDRVQAPSDPAGELRLQAASSIRGLAQEREQEGRSALGSLARFVDALSGLPGRKALLLVSGGLSLRRDDSQLGILEAQLAGLSSKGPAGSALAPLPASPEADFTPLLRQVVEHANSSGVTLYTLLVADDASYRRADSRGSLARSASTGGGHFDRQEPMVRLAAETGGSTALDPSEPAGFLGLIQHDFSAYYSLGYASAHPHDGKVHRLEVSVRDPGLRLRHRAAYRDRTGDERIRDRTVSALLFGIADNPLGMALELSDERRDPKGQMLVDLQVKIPMTNLVLLPGERFHRGRLTLFIGLGARRGWTSNLRRVELPFEVANEQLLTANGQLAGYRTTLALRPEETVVAVGVRDELSQAESTVRRTYLPGAATAAGAAGSGQGKGI
jgi:VWFA-related protein